MANEKVSDLIELYASGLQTNDIFLVTDTSQRESKKLELGQLLLYIENTASLNSLHSTLSDTASYVSGTSVNGMVSSSNVSNISTTSVSASWSNNSYSCSYSHTASYVTSTSAVTNAASASYLIYSGGNNGTASYSTTSSVSNTCNNANNAAFLLYSGGNNGTASYSTTSSYVSVAQSASYVTLSQSSSYVNNIYSNLPKTVGVANPMGVIGSGTTQYIWQFNINSSITQLYGVNTNTNNISVLGMNYSGDNQMNVSTLTSDLGNKYLVGFCNSTNHYTFNLITQTYTKFGASINLINYTPVKIVESSYPLTPDFYGVMSAYGTDTNNIVMYKSFYSSGWTNSIIGSNLNLIGNSYVGSSVFNSFDGTNANILFFLHNPIKKRFYLMSNGTGFLHIFNFNTYSGDVVDWWQDLNRYTYLTYEKTIILTGNDAYWNDVLAEHYSLEYDLTTGQEYAIHICRRGNTTLNGSVIRSPWKEN